MSESVRERQPILNVKKSVSSLILLHLSDWFIPIWSSVVLTFSPVFSPLLIPDERPSLETSKSILSLLFCLKYVTYLRCILNMVIFCRF